MTEPPPRDPRVTRSRRAILAATIDLLVERGFWETTIEAVATRSGAAKTTIYRQWPNKRELLLAAVESVIPRAAAPDTGSLRGDLRHFARDLVGVVEAGPLAAVLPGLVAAAERDPDMARLLADFTAQRRQPIHHAVARAAARGETAGDCDPELLAGLVVGAFFYRRLLSRQPVTERFADSLVDAALRAVSSR